MVTVRLGLDEHEDPITSAEYNAFLRMVGEAILSFSPQTAIALPPDKAGGHRAKQTGGNHHSRMVVLP